MLIGYVRPSARGLPVEEQRQQLEAAGCGVVYVETTWSARAELAKAIQAAGFGDTLIITSLDRLAWSVRDLLEVVEKLEAAQAGLRSLSEPWADPQTEQGRHAVNVLRGLAAFNKAAFADRMQTIRRDAIARGAKIGRTQLFTDDEAREIFEAYQSGRAQIKQLMTEYSASQTTIWRAIQRGRAQD